MAALTAGLRVGPYSVISLLGKGGMGEVYRAHDDRLGRDVAVKVLPAAMATDPQALARFEREARAVAALNHPAIVALHDIGTHDGTAYVVTELLDGETVRDRLERDGPLPPRRALGIAAQVAEGLGAAHARGIVHRDVKPENLFLLADGRVKVLDFGIARQMPTDAVTQETALHTQPGVVMGTFGYVAPEVLRGETATPRSDIFAFGVVVYEMLTGTNPFRRATVMETVSAVLRDDPPPLGQTVRDLPPGAARLVHRCLAARPDDRPDSLRDVAQHLLSLMEDVSAPAASGLPVSDVSGGDWPLGRVRRWVAGATAAGVTALTLAILAYVPWSGAPGPGGRGGTLERVPRIVALAQEARLSQLQLTARLVASFPQLSALLDTDVPTVEAFLADYRSVETPLLIALDRDGRVLGSTDEAVLASGAATEQLTALQATPGGAIVRIGGRPHLAASAAAEAGGTIFGLVVVATAVDDGFARRLGDVTEGEVIVLDREAVRGTTLRAATLPWQALPAWHAEGGSPDATTVVNVNGRSYVAREVSLSSDPALSAVVLRAQDQARSSAEALWPRVITVAVVVLLLGVAIAWWLPEAASDSSRHRS